MKKLSYLIPSVIASFLIPLIGMNSCNKKDENPTAIEIQPRKLNIDKFEKYKLQYEVFPKGTSQEVTWESSDESTLVVSNGVITAKKVGQAVVTATSVANPSVSCDCPVNVNYVPATGIELDVHEMVLITDVGEHELNARILPDDAEQEVEWVNSNPDLVEIKTTEDTRKVIIKAIKGKGIGSATITARPKKYPAFSETCKVDVILNPDDPQKVIIIPNRISLETQQTTTLKAEVLPITATGVEIEWKSEDESKVIIEKVEGEQATIKTLDIEGQTQITVTATKGATVLTGNCNVEIKKPPVPELILLDTHVLELAKGESHQFEVTLYPTPTKEWPLHWEVEDTSVLEIDQNGKVSAKQSGSTTVKVSLAEYDYINDVCEVYVRDTSNHTVTFVDNDHGHLVGQKQITVKDSTKICDIKNKPKPEPDSGWTFFGWNIYECYEVVEDITIKPIYVNGNIELDMEDSGFPIPTMEKIVEMDYNKSYTLNVDTSKCVLCEYWGEEYFILDVNNVEEPKYPTLNVSNITVMGKTYKQVEWYSEIDYATYISGADMEDYFSPVVIAFTHVPIQKDFKASITLTVQDITDKTLCFHWGVSS